MSVWEEVLDQNQKLYHVWEFTHHESIEYVEWHGHNLLLAKFRADEFLEFLSRRISGSLPNSPAGLRTDGPGGPPAVACWKPVSYKNVTVPKNREV